MSPRQVPDGSDANVVVALPTTNPDLGSVDFAQTTFYHWEQFSKNVTSGVPEERTDKDIVDGVDYFGVGGSYFLFKDADSLVQGDDDDDVSFKIIICLFPYGRTPLFQ